jgi:hypothetical protein
MIKFEVELIKGSTKMIEVCVLKWFVLGQALVAPPVILAEIRKIVVQSQPRQIVLWDPNSKNPSQKRAGGVAQGVGSEFKP